MNQPLQQRLESAVMQEIQAADAPMIAISADRLVWLSVIGHLQLALRHAANTGQSSLIVIDFIDNIQHQLPASMRELVEMGFDPAYDRQRTFNASRGG